MCLVFRYVGKHFCRFDLDERNGLFLDSVDDDSALIVHDEFISNFFDGVNYLAALAARVGDQEEVGDFLHNSSVDLLDTRLAVDNYIIEVVCQQADDLFKIGVHLAVATGCLWPSDSKEAELLLFKHGIENTEPCFVEHLDRFFRATFLNASDDLFTDTVERICRLYSKCRRKSDRRVCVDSEYPGIWVFLCEDPYHCGGYRCLSNAALTGYC